MHRVFVYGTLKRGLENHGLLRTATFIGEACTVQPYRMLDGRFPVLRNEGPDRAPVSGEAFEVDDATLAKLDDLEDTASGLYDRVEINIAMLDGTPAKAFVYLGGAAYWDARPQTSFVTLNAHGQLDWKPNAVASSARTR